MLLSKRGTFLERGEVMQLLYLGGIEMGAPVIGGGQGKREPAVIALPPPCILRPRQLWSGKQVHAYLCMADTPSHHAPRISFGVRTLLAWAPFLRAHPRIPLAWQVITTLLQHLHPDAKHLNCASPSKTGGDMWSQQQARRGDATSLDGGGAPIDKEEGLVIVRGGELLTGVIDKSAFGSTEFGLVHCVHELLGAEPTGRLLTQLGKLFTGMQPWSEWTVAFGFGGGLSGQLLVSSDCNASEGSRLLQRLHNRHCRHCLAACVCPLLYAGYQQMHGFTCGIGDLLLTDAANAQRSRNIARGEGLGLKAACQFAERDPSGTRSMVRNKRLSVLAPLLARMRRVAFGRGASGGPPWPGSEGARRHHTHRPRCVVLTTIVPPHLTGLSLRLGHH